MILSVTSELNDTNGSSLFVSSVSLATLMKASPREKSRKTTKLAPQRHYSILYQNIETDIVLSNSSELYLSLKF